MELISYNDVLGHLNGRAHILLGNGFSIGCDPIFCYKSLYDEAVSAGLSERAQKIFGRLGTNNFEGVMRLLDDAHWVATEYGIIQGNESEMLEDVEIVKETLIRAISSSHLAHTGEVDDHKKLCAKAFLERYHNIFTTNYDLLLYWVNMSGTKPKFGDGFRSEEDDPDGPHLVFAERLGGSPGIFYLHGALHLFISTQGELLKHSWIRTGRPIIDHVREGLAEKKYPLFVSEGTHEKKLEQIRKNSYLAYCLGKLNRIENSLVILGHSLAANDQHISDALSGARKLENLFIGLFGDSNTSGNISIRQSADNIVARRANFQATAAGFRNLHLYYFDSSTAPVWSQA